MGLFVDGSPGEVFIKMAKQGSTLSGLVDTIGILMSMSLQYGVPLEAITGKLRHMRFEPAGWTPNAEIPQACSIVDYIANWLTAKFVTRGT